MGPGRAALYFKEKNPEADLYRVTLYGSLALTGRVHGTDSAIQRFFYDPEKTEIIWEPEKTLPHHPNGMLFEAFVCGRLTDSWEE